MRRSHAGAAPRGVLDGDRPATLVRLAPEHPEIARWLAELPERIERCRARWGLDLGVMYPSGHAGWTAPARDRDGREVVLKIQWFHDECEHEARALRHWNGSGAVLLLDEDEGEHALLLERLTPGAPLSTLPPGEALAVLVRLVRLLCVPGPQQVGSLRDEALKWRRNIPRAHARYRGYEPRLRDAALAFIDELVPTQPEQVLLHQDLHGGNVLSARREPWLAIDPKPLIGEKAFALAPIVRSSELGHDRARVRRRFDRLVEALEVDRERARGWVVAQTIAWSSDGTADWYGEAHEVARWMLEG